MFAHPLTSFWTHLEASNCHIVTKKSTIFTKNKIISFLNQTKLLATYKMPKEIKVVKEIPMLPTGKPDIPAIKGERDPIKNKNL